MQTKTSPLSTISPLQLLRDVFTSQKVNGFIIPRTDEHQNEYIPPHAERMSYITNFTGSAGFSIVLDKAAAVFVDGRYTLQAQIEVDQNVFSILPLGLKHICTWLEENLSAGDKLAFDPWLLLDREEKAIRQICEKMGATLVESDNLVDKIWEARPSSPKSVVQVQTVQYAGESLSEKIQKVAAVLKTKGVDALCISQPDLICWLLNIRGRDVPYIPVILSFAIVSREGQVQLFLENLPLSNEVLEHFGEVVKVFSLEDFSQALAGYKNKSVLVDPNTSSVAIPMILTRNNATVVECEDPCLLMRARKNPVEVEGMRQAHIQDAIAVCKFLAWVEATVSQQKITECDACDKLLEFREQGELFQLPSFHSIMGTGPNGAIIHYKPVPENARTLTKGDILLVDSGGQYLNGTTDITRTVSLGGTPTAEQKDRFTRVLKGHIAIANTRFPKDTPGSNLDALARTALWEIGCDYKHGTGHGVGSYLNVHEGPQRISPMPNKVGLEPGMIVSNEPGYYKAGEYGIRIESLVVVRDVPGEYEFPMCCFETLTLIPIELCLIDVNLLSSEELSWLNAYHSRVWEKISPHLTGSALAWLKEKTQPLSKYSHSN